VIPGRLIVPALRWSSATGFAHERSTIAEALQLGVGGFMIFGGTVPAVRALVQELRERAGRRLLIGADLERGAGQQVEGLTEIPPPGALASLGRREACRWAGALTAAEARSVGINWVFAPVADLDLAVENPIVQTRAFGADPERVANCVREWVDGCQGVGALACVKHYPGHGRTLSDSHDTLPVVDVDACELRAVDLVPFHAAVNAKVASVMTAHVSFPSLDPSGRAATFSKIILDSLRENLGFDGLIVTDALIMEGACLAEGEARAAADAVRAGCDLLLHPRDLSAVSNAIHLAHTEGHISEQRLNDAYVRYERALEMSGRPVTSRPAGPFSDTEAMARAILERPVLRGALSGLTEPLELIVVDDDADGPVEVSPCDVVEKSLQGEGVVVGPGGDRVVLAFAEPRGWKGRPGFGGAAREALRAAAPDAALVVLFGHPRLAAEIPEGPPVLLAWHRQRPLQKAAGRWIRERIR
jgi:beta-glucosidase